MRSVDSSMKGCALKTLFLPAVVVVLGVLAALPFRHSAEVDTEPDSASDHSVANRATTAVFPSTVAPLQVDGATSPETASRLLTQLKPFVVEKTEANVPNFDTLPQSYDDIAVPLADRDTAKNLLRKNSANLAETSLTGSQWTFDRFGIPRPTSELQSDPSGPSESFVSATLSSEYRPAGPNLSVGSSLARSNAAQGSAHGEPSQQEALMWSSARPIVDQTPSELVLASELQQQKQDSQHAQLQNQQLAQQTASLEPTETAATEATSGTHDVGVFQAVKDSRIKLRKSAAEAANDPPKRTDRQTVAEPAERKRFWIHEPVKKSS